jgi:hypothetical protein
MSKQNFIGTEASVRQMVRTALHGDAIQQTYLRTLVGTVIAELGAEARTNAATGRRPKLSDEDQVKQLAAADAVYARWEPIIEDEVERSLTADNIPAKERATVKNRRTNIYRTAIYTVRRYIKAGKDITAVPPAKASKSAMKVDTTARPTTPRRLKGRVERRSKAFMAAVLELSESDPQAAVSEIDTLIGQLATQLASLGVEAVRSPAKAVTQHKPLKVGSTVFLPSESAILRQRASPS